MKARHRKPGRPNYRPRSTPRIALRLVDWATDPTFLVLAVVTAYFAVVFSVGVRMAP